MHGSYLNTGDDNYIEGFGVNTPSYIYFKTQESLDLIRSGGMCSDKIAEIEKIENDTLHHNSAYSPEIMFDENFNYSVSETEETIANDSLNINDMSCLNRFFDEKKNIYRVNMNNDGSLQFTPVKTTKMWLEIFIKTKDSPINHLVCAKSYLNYFNSGSTYVKTTIIPDYEKKIASITTQRWSTKNPSYLTEANISTAANIAIIAASLAFIATRIHTAK